jgi:hypothetical protein
MHRLIEWLFRLFLSRSARLEFDLMSAAQDLTANVAALQASVNAYEAAVNAKLAEPAGDDPAVTSASVALVAATQQLDAAAASLQAVPQPV